MNQNNVIIDRMFVEIASIVEEIGGYVDPYYISSNILNGDITGTFSCSNLIIEDEPISFGFNLCLPTYSNYFYFTLRSFPKEKENSNLFIKVTLMFAERRNLEEYRNLFSRVFKEFIEHIKTRVRILKFYKRNESKIELTFESRVDMINIKKMKLFITIKNNPNIEMFNSRYYNKEIVNNIVKYAKKHGLDYSDL